MANDSSILEETDSKFVIVVAPLPWWEQVRQEWTNFMQVGEIVKFASTTQQQVARFKTAWVVKENLKLTASLFQSRNWLTSWESSVADWFTANCNKHRALSWTTGNEANSNSIEQYSVQYSHTAKNDCMVVLTTEWLPWLQTSWGDSSYFGTRG